MKKIFSLLVAFIMVFTIVTPTTVSAASKPAKVKISSVSAVSSSSIKIKWKKVSGADGYVIYQKKGSGKFEKIKTITSGKTTSYTKKKLSSGKKYTYKIRAYDKVGKKKIYGAYSSTKSAYTKAELKLNTKYTTYYYDKNEISSITLKFLKNGTVDYQFDFYSTSKADAIDKTTIKHNKKTYYYVGGGGFSGEDTYKVSKDTITIKSLINKKYKTVKKFSILANGSLKTTYSNGDLFLKGDIFKN